MRPLKAVGMLLLFSVLAVAVTGCRGCLKDSWWNRCFRQKTCDPMAPQGGIESSVLPEPIRGQTPQESPDLKRIYFGFDSASLLEPAKKQLAANAEWLRANACVQVQIEGHCDERGTDDYNYSLGQRRADAARNFLMSQGIQPERLHTISYGSERPDDSAHGEMAWARNRRVQFLIYGSP